MSRSARAPDDQTKLKKQLNDLMKLDENKFCADCGCRGPRWASINLGVFICIACSGIHRSLGVHLTFVRSVNLDSWTTEQVQQMQRWGNARAKAYFEANVPRDYRIPTEHSSVRDKEMWIRDKYERKLFVEDVVRETKRQEARPGRRKKRGEDKEKEEDVPPRRERRKEKTESPQQKSRPIVQEAKPMPKSAASVDILSFDVFDAPPVPAPTSTPATGSVPEAPSVPTGQQPKQDEWASFGGSTNAQSGFKDAFAPQAPAPVDQHANKMANIMASFGTMTQQQPPQQQQQQQPQRNAFPPQQGMTPAGSMMEMHMNGMGMMQPRPMGMSLPMNMPMGGQPFMNPMMGHQANLMMGYPMQNQMFGAPQQNGLMMGVAAPRGFPSPPMVMNPMGMHMNMGGFQQQQQLQQQQLQQQQLQQQQLQQQQLQQQQLQQQQQQQHQQQQLQVGGLSQPFVNFG